MLHRLVSSACLGLLASAVCVGIVKGEPAFGPHGPEGQRLREQLWIVPGKDPNVPLRATVFRPTEAQAAHRDHRRPLVVINHGTDSLTREAAPMPIFYWLSRWFVDRGYVVLLPQRRGHGSTAGELAEAKDHCAGPDHYGAGLVAADDIEHALRFMASQPFIDPSHILVAGLSSGGWASLALAARNPDGVRGVINFAGGRGGHAYGQSHVVCAPDRLVSAAGSYGQSARVPTLWLYSRNDSYFGPDLADAMKQAWTHAGGKAELALLPAFRSEGHDFVFDLAAVDVWGPLLQRFLTEQHLNAGNVPRISSR